MSKTISIRKQKLEFVPYTDFVKMDFNTLKSNENRDVSKLKKSILKSQFTTPILAWKDYVADGTGRRQALAELAKEGYTIPDLPVLFFEAKNIKEAKKIVLLINSQHGEITQTSLADFTSFDFDLEELQEMALQEVSMGSLDFMLEQLESEQLPDEEINDTPPPDRKAKLVQIGDIFELEVDGLKSRVMCGDCTVVDNVEKLMNGQKADLAHNDPPYGMKKEKDGVIGDNMNYEDLLQFNKDWIFLQWQYIKDNGSWYCWGIDEPLMDIYSQIIKPLVSDQKATFRNLITWDKAHGQGQNSENTRSFAIADEKCLFVMSGVQGSNNNADNYFEGWEPIRDYLYNESVKCQIANSNSFNTALGLKTSGGGMYAHHISPTGSQWTLITAQNYLKLQQYAKQNNIDAFKKEYNQLQTEYNSTRAYFNNTHENMNNVWHFERHAKQGDEGNHATPKPLPLCQRAIKSSCPEFGLIIDFFLGSGSTLIASIQTGRRCFGLELDPVYVEVIIKRATVYLTKNDKPYKLTLNGEPFDVEKLN